MSRLHNLEESVSMRFLGEGLDESTAVADEERWPSHDGSPRRFLTRLLSQSPDSCFALLRGWRILFRVIYGVLLLTIAAIVIFVSREPIIEGVRSWHTGATTPEEESSAFLLHDHSLYIVGTPSMRFRDNIVNGTKYVTAWPIGGFSNQVMAQINLLYLAVLALRIPVLADFVPGHMHGNPGFLPVSDVYDLPRLASFLQIPVLEWSEFKNRSPQHETEFIGCWSPHMTTFNSPGHYASEFQWGLDISLTPVPDTRFHGHENMQNIMALASLGWPEQRASALRQSTPLPSLANQRAIQPDDTMLCFDELFYADSVRAYEWTEEWVPMWTQVGKYLHWEPKMEALARNYVMRAFGLSDSDPFPSYISVHIRHTDFASLCHDHDAGRCFPPLAAYGEKVDEIRRELFAQHGDHVEDVFVTSDELDAGWWASVKEQGWHRIDWEAEKAEEIYSEWYPIVMDSVALSFGKGFVGTTRSTLSLLASKRVQDWENGFAKWVTLSS